jgi:hypothetical protein
VGPKSTVDITTRYGLNGPGIQCRWGRDFPDPFRPVLGPIQPPLKMGTGYFQGAKGPGRSVDHLPPSIAEVKVKAEL